MGTEIFFGKTEIRLDTPVNKRPVGQITARRREQNPLVSRTRCSVLHDAPQSRDLYCRLLPCEVDPGSAAHRRSASKTRKRADGAAQHPGNDRSASRLAIVHCGIVSKVTKASLLLIL